MQNETLALDDTIMADRGRLTGIAALHNQPCHLPAVRGVGFLYEIPGKATLNSLVEYNEGFPKPYSAFK
jgi:hypothetical protein